MVHNGIEYGDMQLICEAYHLMKEGLGMTADEMHQVFAEWNEGDLDSYLIEITRDILGYKDEDGEPLVEKILDTAGQKGTGKWTVINSAELGIPITLIGEAVFSRCISAMKDDRVAARLLPSHASMEQTLRVLYAMPTLRALHGARAGFLVGVHCQDVASPPPPSAARAPRG